MCFSKSIFVKILEKFGEVFDSTFENWKLEKEKGFVKKKRESPSQPSRPAQASPTPSRTAPLPSLSFSSSTPCSSRTQTETESKSRGNRNKIESIRSPEPLYLNPISSASFCPKNPSIPPPGCPCSSSSRRCTRRR